MAWPPRLPSRPAEGGSALVGPMLICPMIDDRTASRDAELERVALWTYDDHVTAWTAWVGPDPVESPYATPLRADDLRGLPASSVEVGELDSSRAASLDYVYRLLVAGVPVKFHLRPSVPHAFELFAPAADVSCRALGDRYRFLLHITNKSLPGYRQIEGTNPHTSRCSVQEALTEAPIPARPAFTWADRRRSTCYDVVMFRRSALRYLVVVHDLQNICTY